MITQNDIHRLLSSFSIREDDTVTIHASLRAAGPIEGGADGLIDGLKSYLHRGLLLIPTHTWANVNAANPLFDVRSTRPCIGTLATVAAFREDAVRSLHPTHSLAGFGAQAAAYLAGEEHASTPAPVGGALSRLYERHGKVLLIGVGHERNTYLHAVDERMNQPNRLAKVGFPVTIIDQEGREHRNADFHPHHTEGIPVGLSEYYPNYTPALEAAGAVQYGALGSATVICCDCRKMTDAVIALWQHADHDFCLHDFVLPESWYRP